MDKDVDYIALGIRVRNARERKNITQEKLAEICSLSTSYIGHIERGSRIPSLETICKISAALKVSIDYLIFDSFQTDLSLFENITALLKGKNPIKVKTFMAVVRVLADKIDEL